MWVIIASDIVSDLSEFVCTMYCVGQTSSPLRREDLEQMSCSTLVISENAVNNSLSQTSVTPERGTPERKRVSVSRRKSERIWHYAEEL